jgi:hypothetical protein
MHAPTGHAAPLQVRVPPRPQRRVAGPKPLRAASTGHVHRRDGPRDARHLRTMHRRRAVDNGAGRGRHRGLCAQLSVSAVLRPEGQHPVHGQPPRRPNHGRVAETLPGPRRVCSHPCAAGAAAAPTRVLVHLSRVRHVPHRSGHEETLQYARVPTFRPPSVHLPPTFRPPSAHFPQARSAPCWA